MGSIFDSGGCKFCNDSGPCEKHQAKPNALQSLWGSGDVERDRKRRNTAKSMISPAEGGTDRPQEIYTPKVVLDVVAEVWPEGILLDPCSGPQSLVKAKVACLGPDHGGKDGLEVEWPDFTYVNPPYKYLKDWLAKAVKEATGDYSKDHKEIIVLCPVRTHRKWWREAAKLCDAISWMDPLKFEGYAQAFPAPLCLMYWGNRVETFQEAQMKLSK